MQLTLFKSRSLRQYSLPENIHGQYWVTDTGKDGTEIRLFSVEALNGEWHIQSTSNAVLRDDRGEFTKSVLLKERHFISALLQVSSENAFVYVEPLTDDRRIFTKYILPPSGTVRIGRSDDNDICYKNPFVSGLNSEILIEGSRMTVEDKSSRNGTFVNGTRKSRHTLSPGEVIFIMGLKIVVGRGFLALNCPDSLVRINGRILRPFVKQKAELLCENPVDALPPGTIFYRSPRFKRDVDTVTISIDPPSQKATAEPVPIILSIGPSLTMGLSSLTMASTTIIGLANGSSTFLRAFPSLMMSVAMMCGTLLWPTLLKRHDRKKREEREGMRQQKYSEYIRGVETQISNATAYQREVLNENFVSLSTCFSRIKLVQRNLWERNINHNDFLALRLGTGTLPLDVEFSGQRRKFSENEDNLQEMQYRLMEKQHLLNNVPITLPLAEDHLAGVLGDRAQVVALIKSFIMQIAALHSYDEVKMVFIYDSSEEDIWSFARWLPHAWSDNRQVRYVAASDVEIKEISSYLDHELETRLERNGYSPETTPSYVVFALGQGLPERIELLKKIFRHKNNVGFSVIVAADEINDLPKETKKVIELSDSSARMFDKNDINRSCIEFRPEYCVEKNILDYAAALANIHLDIAPESSQLPSVLSFLEMYGIGKVEHLNVLTRWKENDCTVSLEAPIGVAADGELIKLDVHERFHGPHGLVAGTTGSGKSQLLITYILSMAANYHPDEVAFILIDYKGGNMAKTFERLPHTAGIITNLDGSEVKRSLVSINSELKRRQELLTRASQRTGISNLDIYSYQKLYRAKKVSEPLPHLLIIADEFAELKQQQSEFMAELISAARIGRSLGIHLILATQKPTGVVDDQITSNVRFKICLRVEDRHDSMEMLRRPDAAELVGTGRFFIQIGNNELFRLGQSAWCGKSYQPSNRVADNIDNSVSVITNTGRVIRQASIDLGSLINLGSQLDNIVSYISQIAAAENIRTRQLWCAPISASTTLEDLERKYGVPQTVNGSLCPIIGEYDLPEQQEQRILTLPLTESGNTVIYGASGSGKTMFVTTLMYSLIKYYTPDQVHIYALDFQSQTLAAFAGAPHVGDVVLSDNAEKIDNLFKLLNSEIRSRRQLFQEYGGDYKTYTKVSGSSVPAIVVIVHNYTGLTESCEEAEDAIAQLSRDSSKYGIYFVATVSSSSAMRLKVQQNFGSQYVLQMNDPHDYSVILGRLEGMTPSKHIGRGIFKPGNAYEFQIAQCMSGTADFAALRSFSRSAADEWHGGTAREIPVLPDAVNPHFLRRHMAGLAPELLPVGVDKDKLNVIHYPLLGAVMTWAIYETGNVSLFAEGLAETAVMKNGVRVIALDPNGAFARESDCGYEYAASQQEINTGVSQLFGEILSRHKQLKADPGASFESILCIVNSMDSLMKALEDSVQTDFVDALVHLRPEFNVHFVLCDSADFFNIASGRDWAREHTSMRDFIFVGNGIAAQFKLKIDKKPAGLRDHFTESFGVVVRGSAAVIGKLLVPQSWKEDNNG